MCEELLNILASVKPGVSIKIMMYKNTVTVKLHYHPWVVGVGTTLPLAVLDCLNWLLDVVEENPEEYLHLVPMLKKLEEAL